MRRLAWCGLGVVCALFACGDDGGGSGSAGSGAGSTGAGAGYNTTDPGWWEDVAPIVYANCVSCHQEGGIAPMPLISYEDALVVAPIMAASVESRMMPPWGVDNSGDCNTFEDARWLKDEEIAVIRAWVDDGMPEGDPQNAPELPGELPGLEQVTHTLDSGVDYEPDGSIDDDYRCFVVDPGISQDMFLTAYEVKPGDERVVHHVILYALDASATAEAEQLDAADPRPGYSCFGGSEVGGEFVAGWAPGTPPTRYPEGTGPRLRAGAKIAMQIHYNLLNGVWSDRTTVDLTLSDDAREALILPIADYSLSLPPGMDSVTESDTTQNPSPIPVTVYGVFPHMHQLGRQMRVVTRRGAEEICMVDVPNWDFNWQQFYLYDEPITVMPGDELEISCTYNTEGKTQTTTWGEGTQDEMCINFFYLTTP